MIKQASRYNAGKIPWSLVDFNSLEDLVKVLEFGAKKYTKSINFTVDNLLKVCNVSTIQIKKFGLGNFVNAVITSGSENQIQDMLSDRETIVIHGIRRTQEDLEIEFTRSYRLKLEHWLKENEELLNTVYPMNTTLSLSQKVVAFVEAWNGYILTMTTKQGSSEEYYVVNTTKDLDCLTTIFKVLKELSLISEDTNLDNDSIVISGVNNWQKGLNREEVLESALRHLIALLKGEETDPESNLPHEAHVMCNMMFYSWYRRHNKFSVTRNSPFK